MYLDTLPLIEARVGYGGLGLRGDLGYEGKAVSVGGQPCSRAVSAHPPARVQFALDGRFASFRGRVAINDDVPAGRSHADFTVLADGRAIATAAYVRAGDPPRELAGDLAGARTLELVVTTSRWEFCHAVWLDPSVDEAPAGVGTGALIDCLGRAEIALPAPLAPAERCVATVASRGFEGRLDDLIGSLLANGGCHEAQLVVFVIDGDGACERVAAKYGALAVRCRSLAGVNAMSKAILYSVARVVQARHYLALDADMLVLRDLGPVFGALDACPEGTILACREGNGPGFSNLAHALRTAYGGRDADASRLTITPEEAAYPLVVNDGLFAGGRAAMLSLDGAIREMPEAVRWVDERRDIWWRNQLVFNLALARLGCGVELDGSYNVQLHTQDVQFRSAGARIEAEWRGRPVRVVHFSGVGKNKGREWQGRYARVPDPLHGPGPGDAYADFVSTLRAWLGLRGLSGLAWSFHGTTDAQSGRVRDPSTFPLLSLLHNLIRANGCIRVLETGTARGISAACLASAVAHRPGGRVVTLDPFPNPESGEFWAILPEALRRCIEPRPVGSIEGMAAAIEAGERYQAALLDSVHEEEHVWSEFRLATRLVCAGGLILIHDAIYLHGTVEKALRRIEAAGYGVARLWTAEEGVPEDDHLGLAVIENRARAIDGGGAS